LLINRRGEVPFACDAVLTIGQFRIDLSGAAEYPIAASAFHASGDKTNIVRRAVCLRQPEAVNDRLALGRQIAEHLGHVHRAVYLQLARQAAWQYLAWGERVPQNAAFAHGWFDQALYFG
jgi:hypothetical protein